MGVMGRANAALGGGAAGSGEPFLSKDELIRYKTPLAIRDIAYDPYGSSQYRTPRWVLTVEAWDANHPIPDSAYPADRDVEPAGLITFGASEIRNSQFGDGREQDGTPIGLGSQLEDARAQGVEWIGPVAVISALSNKRQPFKTLADVQLDQAGNVVVDNRGFPILEGLPEQQPVRTRAAAAGPPPVAAAGQSTGQRQRRATRAAQTPPAPPDNPPAAAAAPVRVPRGPRTPATGAAAPAAQPAAPPPPAARRRAAPAQQAAPTVPPSDVAAPAGAAAYEAQQQRAAAAHPVGPAPGVQERTETIDEGGATCPFCHVEIRGRLYPANAEGFARAYDESARVFGWPPLDAQQAAAGGQIVMHPNCPAIQRTITLPYVTFEE